MARETMDEATMGAGGAAAGDAARPAGDAAGPAGEPAAGTAIDAHARALGIEVPFLTDLGVRVLEFGEGRAVLSLDTQRRHTNSLGATHGGVVMTLLDVGMAMAARSYADRAGQTVVTIEMSTSFMRPGMGAVSAHGICLHRTATMAFCEAEVRNAAGEICAKAKGTFKYWKRAVSAE